MNKNERKNIRCKNNIRRNDNMQSGRGGMNGISVKSRWND